MTACTGSPPDADAISCRLQATGDAFNREAGRHPLALSIGVVRGEAQGSHEDWLERVDRMMYEEKLAKREAARGGPKVASRAKT